MGISEGITRFMKHADIHIIIRQNVFQITEEFKYKTTAAANATSKTT